MAASAALAFAVLVAAAPEPALADNEFATLVLHAVPFRQRNDCRTPQRAGFDCRARKASVQVDAYADVDVYLFLFGYDRVAGVQCKFEWPADWVFYGWRQNCRPQQLSAVVPEAGGERNLVTAFDEVNRADGLIPVGWLQMTAGGAGCLTVGESDFPYGTGVATGGSEPSMTQVPAGHRGSVCVGTSGTDACNAAGELPESSWGNIKASYER